jgi:hypothetical protein
MNGPTPSAAPQRGKERAREGERLPGIGTNTQASGRQRVPLIAISARKSKK